MKLTKFEHACFVAEIDGTSLVVDPGDFTTDFVQPAQVVAVVITHEHPDHLGESLLQKIVSSNPGVIVIGHPDVVSHVKMTPVREVKQGDTISVGPFNLEFFGGKHAVIHQDIPVIANLGVMINEKLYYPGDSFTLPEKPVEVLAIPASAPWMKISEAMDFLAAVKPKIAFPTHDAILSDVGKNLADRMLGVVAEKASVTYQRLQEPVEL